MLSKYRMEKAYPEMEKARLTSKLNAVRQRIKEVEAQLDEARRNAAFETKYKDDPYWKIAKKRYIETGDPAAIENFRAKQDALETAEKDRIARRQSDIEQKAKQIVYDEADARKSIRLAQSALDAANKVQDSRQIEEAKIELEYAKDYYERVTGKPYKEPNDEKKDRPLPEGNDPADDSNWLGSAPLYDRSGAKDALSYGSYIKKFDDSKGNEHRFETEAEKATVLEWLNANKNKWSALGIDGTNVKSIEEHWTKEKKDKEETWKQEKVKKLRQAWNDALDRNAGYEEKKRLFGELSRYGSKPKDLISKFDIR